MEFFRVGIGVVDAEIGSNGDEHVPPILCEDTSLVL